MKIEVIKNNESLFSAWELNNLTKRRNFLKKLTQTKHFILKDIIYFESKLNIISNNEGENIITNEVELIFNWYRENLVRLYKEWDKITNNDKRFFIKWDKVSVNFVLFFLTRKHLLLYLNTYKKWQYIKNIKWSNFLNTPIPEPKSRNTINDISLTKVIEEILLAEKENMFFMINILWGAIVEFILETLIKNELLDKNIIPFKLKEEFIQINWLTKLIKIYKLIKDDRIYTKISDIQHRRNMIHPNVLKKWIWDIEKKSKQTLLDLEELILYFWL